MKIVSPLNDVHETTLLIDAGACELYCGVLPPEWHRKYANMASINRAERARSSLSSFDELRQVADIAHDRGARVLLALNGLYTTDQYALLDPQIDAAIGAGIDAFIVADMGLLLTLRAREVNTEIHISTGGTAFNADAVRFYRRLGAHRVVIPRQLRLSEIQEILTGFEDIESEVFVLNAGCRNITGFCTLQHGITEASHKKLWGASERAKLGHAALNLLRRMPKSIVNWLNSRLDLFGTIAPCMLDFDVLPYGDETNESEPDDEMKERLKARFFDYFYQLDTCGACTLYDFASMNIQYVKIVGRGYETRKKVNDVRFLSAAIKQLDAQPDRQGFEDYVKALYRSVYGVDCRRLCYYARDEEA